MEVYDMPKVISAVQLAIDSIGDVPVTVDGVWGPESRAAFAKLDVKIRTGLQRAITKLGFDPAFLDTKTHDAVMASLTIASRVTGQSLQFLTTVATIESSLNPLAENGSHKGLFQMSEEAWDEASDYLKNVVHYRSVIGSYRKVFNPLDSALHGAAYLALTRARLAKKLGRHASDAETYLAYQQGVSGLTRIIQGPTDMAIETAMRNNPPPDGAGATSDPGEFVQRWTKAFYNASRDAIRLT